MSHSTAQRTQRLTQQLVRQALLAPTIDEADDALALLVNRTLQQGNDTPIHQALDALHQQSAEFAIGALAFWAETYATTRHDLVQHPAPPVSPSPSPTKDPDDEVPIEASLFLLPLWFPPGSSSTLPTPTTRWAEPLIDSFYQHDLVPPDSTLFVFPEAYATTDLPTTWSGRRQWLDMGIHQILHPDAPPIYPHSHDTTPPSEVAWTIRWIVGIVLAPLDATLPWLEGPVTMDEEEDDEAPILIDWEDWQTTLQETLAPLLPPTSHIHPPGPWFATLTEELTNFHSTAFLAQWEALGFEPSTPVTVHQLNPTTWAIDWTTAQGTTTYHWTGPLPFQNTTTLLNIVHTLHQLPISSLHVQWLPPSKLPTIHSIAPPS